MKRFFVINKIDENFYLLDIYINLEVNMKFIGNLKLFRMRGFLIVLIQDSIRNKIIIWVISVVMNARFQG